MGLARLGAAGLGESQSEATRFVVKSWGRATVCVCVCTCYVKTRWDPDASTHGEIARVEGELEAEGGGRAF